MSAVERYGGFWLRVLAALIDTIVFMAIEAPFLLLAYGPGYYSWGPGSGKLVEGWVDLLVSWILPFVLTVLFWRYKRATPGKMVLKMEIVDADTGETPSVLQCVLRYVGMFLAAIPCGLGLLFVAFDERKRGWHDRLANTVVRRT